MAKKKKDQIESVAGFVFKCVWLAIALLMFFIGLYVGGVGSFGAWMLWGVFCIFPIVGDTLKRAIQQAREGARRGANDYTVTVDSDSVTVKNHPFREAFVGLIAGILGGILVGPVVLGLKMITALIQILAYIPVLAKKQKTE